MFEAITVKVWTVSCHLVRDNSNPACPRYSGPVFPTIAKARKHAKQVNAECQ